MDANYHNPIVGIISRGRVKKIIKELGNLENKTILDAGCEAGYISLKILDKCKPEKIFAIDVCEDALDKFRSKVRTQLPLMMQSRLTIEKGMIQKLPYKDDLFDWVV